jgi:hypothetical protein
VPRLCGRALTAVLVRLAEVTCLVGPTADCEYIASAREPASNPPFPARLLSPDQLVFRQVKAIGLKPFTHSLDCLITSDSN